MSEKAASIDEYLDGIDPAGNDTLIWPHRDGLIWPRQRHSGAVMTV